MGKDQHVVKHKNGWAVEGENNKKPTRIVETQQEAIKIARDICIHQKSELIIHGADGKFAKRTATVMTLKM